MELKISIRNLVEFIYRNGNISDGKSGTLSKEAMNAGSRIHRKLQNMAGSYYNAEVPLKIAMVKGKFDITVIVEGRADGIIDMRGARKLPEHRLGGHHVMVQFEHGEDLEVPEHGENHEMPEPAEVTIDEIKGVYKRLDEIEKPDNVHLAQAMCYAYIYAKEHGLSSINVQISYVNLDNENIRQLVTTFSFTYLEQWFQKTIDELMKWVDFAVEHGQKRNASIEQLEFPYEYRKGQKQMAACVYKALEGGKRLFIQAPTGIGKTMAAVFPTIKSFGQGITSKMFYLTAKTIAHTVADNAIEHLRKQGLEFSSVIITAKEKLCPLEEMDCDGEKCPYAKGHYDRVNAALYDLITHKDRITREDILEFADKYTVCPFELCLDASLFADGIICDYNYVFDARVNLKRFFADVPANTGRYAFLVDEAHNLVERASSMYSAELYKEEILELKNIVKKYSTKLTKSLNSCNREMLAMKKECGTVGVKVLNDIGVLYLKLLGLHGLLEEFLEEYKHIEERKAVLEFYFSLTSFLNIAELLADNYVIYQELFPDGTFMVKLYCVKPAANLSLCLEKGIGAIFFSATILPVRYYMEMLSDSSQDMAIYIPSPFEQKKRRILIGRDVTTRYNRRNDDEYHKIFLYIRHTVKAQKGNYMVFFPSYLMMNKVYDIAEQYYGGTEAEEVSLLMQGSGMTEHEREEFLLTFAQKDNVLAFCIMGGIFSEGIDLDHDKLIGAIVVGPGLPQVCNERKLLMDYFDDYHAREVSDAYLLSDTAKGGRDGFLYAYLYPGINKVFQAAGRVIRTEEDKGVIVLLDERFATKEYYQLFPMEWNDADYCTLQSIEKELKDFWENS